MIEHELLLLAVRCLGIIAGAMVVLHWLDLLERWLIRRLNARFRN